MIESRQRKYSEILAKLAQIANKLDQIGLSAEANQIDKIIIAEEIGDFDDWYRELLEHLHDELGEEETKRIYYTFLNKKNLEEKELLGELSWQFLPHKAGEEMQPDEYFLDKAMTWVQNRKRQFADQSRVETSDLLQMETNAILEQIVPLSTYIPPSVPTEPGIPPTEEATFPGTEFTE